MAAAAVERIGRRLAGAVIVAPERGSTRLSRIRRFVGGHPLPDRGSLRAGQAVRALLRHAAPGDLVLVLLSGGASSLLVLPAAGLTLADKARTSELLLRAGATIAETNTVRKHLSRLKGGGMLRAAGAARVVCLILSDVVGSSAAVVGSGPAAADPSRYADALAVLERRGILGRVPARVRRHLERGKKGLRPETVKPGERRSTNVVIGDNRVALAAAAARARSLGYEARVLTASMRGDTCRAARRLAQEIRRARRRRRPVCLLAGGETTVRVRGDGRGGRNQELALALAIELRGLGGVRCLIAGSDGRDGPTDAAGALVDGGSCARAIAAGLDPRSFLARNDSYTFFERLGGALFRPGPTGTNVMDLDVVLIHPGLA